MYRVFVFRKKGDISIETTESVQPKKTTKDDDEVESKRRRIE